MTPTIRFKPGPKPVTVIFSNGAAVECPSIKAARDLLDRLENNPPEKRGENFQANSQSAQGARPCRTS